METEVWKDIPGYVGYYMASTLGRVRNKKGYIMKSFKKYKDKSYQQIVLCKDGVKTTFSLHKLIGLTFPEICGDWFDGAEIDHIDGNPSNNAARNLRFVSHIENVRNPITKLRTYGHKTRKRAISQLTLDDRYVRTWETIKDAADYYGFSPSNISSVLSGRYKSSHGFKWEYATPSYSHPLQSVPAPLS